MRSITLSKIDVLAVCILVFRDTLIAFGLTLLIVYWPCALHGHAALGCSEPVDSDTLWLLTAAMLLLIGAFRVVRHHAEGERNGPR